VPHGIAYPDNRFYRRLFEQERAELERKDHEARTRAESVAKKGEGVKVEFTMKFGAQGKMFGSITNVMISEKLAEQGVEVDRRKIHIPSPIRTPGEHILTVKPYGDVTFDITVNVIADIVEQQLEEISIRELIERNTGEGEPVPEAVEQGAEEAAAMAAEAKDTSKSDGIVEMIPAEKPSTESEVEAPADETETTVESEEDKEKTDE
jgi:large subunit ribosomal protein L9